MTTEGMPTTPVHQSTIRPVLMLGVERELAVIEATLIASLTLGLGGNLLGIGLAAVIVVVVHPLLLLATKNDPQMVRVYARHLRFRLFYPALAHPDAPAPRPTPWS